MEAVGLLDFSLSPPVDSRFDAMTPATVWTATTYMTSDGMRFARVVWFDEGIVAGSCTSSGCANRTRCVRGP